MMKLPTAYDIVLSPAKEERLSQIIREINSRTGRQYDNDVAIKAALQIRDIMKKSEELKTSAKNNSEQDFEFAYFDHVDDALIDGLEQNQDFFTLLLQNDEIKHEVLGLFLSDTYHSLRNGGDVGSGIVYQYENTTPMMVAEESAYYGEENQ